LSGKAGKYLHARDEDDLKGKEHRGSTREIGGYLHEVHAVAFRLQTGQRHADGEWRKKHGGPSRNSDEEELSMKMRIVSLLVFASLILAFAFLASTPAAPNKASVPATPAASALPATPATATPAEPHPEIREALQSLRRAKGHLEHAAHDFGGHRVEAIEATNRAIEQLELCLKFDKD
jgi:hypothetical protein